MKKFYALVLSLISITGWSQNSDTSLISISNFRLENGTYSWRGTNSYHDMNSWDTSPYLEGHLKQKNGANWAFRLNYRLLLPLGYDANYDEGYPILIFLHGGGERANCWGERCYCEGCNSNGTPNPEASDEFLNNDHQLLHGGKPFLDAVNLAGTKKLGDPSLNAKAFPGVILFPQNEDYWGSADGGNSPLSYALRILRLIIKDYNINPDRVYIAGLSVGGQAVYKALNMADWLFAAGITMSAINFSNSLEYDSVATIPLWAFQGGKDTDPKPSQTEALIRKFREAGGTARYTLYSEAGHNTWNKAFREPDFFSWLLNRKKSDIHTKYNNPNICSTNETGAELMLAEGFPVYQWEFDGNIIPNANSATLMADQPGVYRGRFSRVVSPSDNDWNEWSSPVTVQEKTPEQPEIIQTGTTYLRDLNGTKEAILKGPEGKAHYYWYKDGELSDLNDSVNATVASGNCGTPCANTGRYTLVTADFDNCPSFPSSVKYLFFEDQAPIDNTMRPASFSAELLTSSTSYISWNDPSNIESGYEVWRRNTSISNSKWTLAALTKANITFFRDSMLIPNSTYYYKIRAISNTSRSDYFPGNHISKAEENLVVNTPNENDQPLPPQNLSASLVGVNKIRLKWNKGWDESRIKEYQIIYNGEVLRTGQPDTTYTLSGLTLNTNYVITVRTIDLSENISAPSNQVTTHTYTNGLFYKHSTGSWTSLDDPTLQATWESPEHTGTVTNISLTPRVQEDYFNFEFEGYIYIASAGNYTFYLNSDDGSRLYLDNNLIIDFDGAHGTCQGGAGSTTCPNGWGTPSQSISLSAGPHLIRLQYFEYTGSQTLMLRYNGPDTGNQGVLIPNNALTSGSYTPPALLPAPTNLQASGFGLTAIRLNWNASVGSNIQYEIYRSLTTNGDFQIIDRTSDLTYTDLLVTPGQVYYYKLKAVSTNNTSAFSTVASAQTEIDSEVPSQPTGLLAESGNFTKAILKWNASTDNVGISGYEIWGNGVLLGTTNIPAYEVALPEPGEIYTFYIIAFDASGNKSTPSESVTNESLVTDVEKNPGYGLKVSIYPNPSSQQELQIKISSDNRSTIGITIINIMNTVVYRHTIEQPSEEEEYSLPLTLSLSDGMYLIMTNQENTTVSKKVIIKK